MSAWEKVLIKCPKITITFRHIRKNIISNQSLRANLDKSVSGFYPKTSYGGVFGQTLFKDFLVKSHFKRNTQKSK